MDCWYPINIPRHSNYKGSNNLLYTRVYGYMQVPCGRCPPCRRRKQNEWAFRILEEAKYSKLTSFITLTLEDNFLSFTDEGVATLDPKRAKKFCKDLLYRIGSYRYFLCGEYGDSFERPHYHLCLFYNGDLSHEQVEKFVRLCWQDGFITYEPTISAGRAKYCAKYSMKQIGFDYQGAIPPFARMSRRPGIGKKFLDLLDIDNFRKHDLWSVHDYQGTPYALPRYYKERIYSKDECEQHSMLLEKLKSYELDKNIREYDNYFKFDYNSRLNCERLFIKHLKKENYGFKYTPYRPKEKRHFSRSDLRYSEEFKINDFEA